MIADLKPYPAYKDSGVPWLGNVPAHWEVRRLKQAFRRIVGGSTPSSADASFWDGDVVWITPADVSKSEHLSASLRRITRDGFNSCSSGLVPPGSIVVTSRAPVGNVAIAEVELCTNQGCKALVVSEAVISEYGFTVLSTLKVELQSLATGTTFTEISTSRLADVLMPLPPRPEQAAIVRFVDHADRRIRRYIRAKQKLIKLLEEQKQAIIHRAVTRGLDPNVRLKPSGVEWLGDVPKHWKVRKLGEIAVSFRTGPFGSILHQSDYVDGGTPLINPTHMSGGSIIENTRCSVPPAVAGRLSHYRLDKHDLIFSRRGELGRCALVRDREIGWLCGTGSIRVRIAYDGIEPEYLIQALQVRWVGEYLSLFSVGATMDSLNTGILKGVPVLVPPTNEQRQVLDGIAQQARSIERAMADAERETDLLREYRTRLIADVVTGKLDVREAAARLPDEAEEPELLDEADGLTDGDEDASNGLDTVPEEA